MPKKPPMPMKSMPKKTGKAMADEKMPPRGFAQFAKKGKKA